MKSVQWAPSGNPLEGVPGEVMRLLAKDGRSFGYGYGPGWSVLFGSEHGDISVLPGQWVLRHDDDTITVQFSDPNSSNLLPTPASCGANLCTADEFGPHAHRDGIITFEDGGDNFSKKFARATFAEKTPQDIARLRSFADKAAGR